MIDKVSVNEVTSEISSNSNSIDTFSEIAKAQGYNLSREEIDSANKTLMKFFKTLYDVYNDNPYFDN